MTKEDFIDAILTGLTPPPGYFPQNVMMNIQGYESIDTVVKKGTTALDVKAFESEMKKTSAIILDTRDAQTFAKAFIPKSYNIGLDGSFANWVGTTIIDLKQPILIIAEEGREEEAVKRLARIGFDNTLGYLTGGMKAWMLAGREIDAILSISAGELVHKMQKEEVNVVDVRRASEYHSEHIENAINIPLDYLKDSEFKIDKNKTYYVHCRSGYRSMVFISILRAKGYKNLMDVKGGIEAVKENGTFKLSEYLAPTTLL